MSKLVKLWENKNAQRALRGAGLSTFALSLAACGGSSDTVDSGDGVDAGGTATVNSIKVVEAGTTTLDNLDGTAGADEFTAAGGRLNDGDVLNGLGGADVLTATIDASADAYLTGIETLNITALGTSASMDGVRLSDVTDINVSGGGTLTLASAAAGINYSVDGAGTALTLSQAGTDSETDVVNVTVKTGTLGTLSLGDTAGVDFETINITVAGAGKATLTEAGTTNFAQTTDSIKVTGTGDYTLVVDAGAMGEHATAGVKTVVDASGHTGTFTLDLTTLDATNKVINAEGYTGVDVLQIGLAGLNSVTSLASGTKVVVDTAETDGTSTLTLAPRTGTNDNVNVELAHGTAGSKIDLTTLTLDGFETATVTSLGTNSSSTTVVNNIDTIAGTATDQTLTIAGDHKLVAGIENTWTSVTVTNTSGSDLTIASGNAVSVTGGAGVDRIEMDTVADITSADSLNGGAGEDTLAISAVIGTDFTSAQRAVISNFEILEYKGAQDLTAAGTKTVDLTNLTGINTLYLNGAVTTDTDGLLVIKADSGFKLITNAAVAANTTWMQVDITNAANAGTNDTVTLAFNGDIAATADLSFDGVTIDNVENLVIDVKGVQDDDAVITIDDIDGAQLQTLTVNSTAGNNTDGTAKTAESLTITTIESTALNTIDATSFTGAFDASGLASKLIGTGATLKGGSGVDTFTGGAGADTINGNGGADILKGGTGNDTIDGGAGNDNINGQAGADTLTGGAGVDTFVIATGESTETAMDTITDFAKTSIATSGADKLDIAATTISAVTAGASTGVTNVTATVSAGGVMTLQGTAASTIDTLAEWIDAAEVVAAGKIADSDTNTGSTVDYLNIVFEFGGDTYVLTGHETDGANYATDSIVLLDNVTGVTGLEATEANLTSGELWIA